MEEGKHINIVTVNKCQLRCNFCINSLLNGKVKETMFTYDQFVETVDRLIDFGVDHFEMTPNIGDVFLDPLFTAKITYLENHPKVRYYGFVTNLLAITPLDMYQLILSQKCDCAISIYGYDEESYEKTTGVNAFNKFQENLSTLASKVEDYENANPFTFYMRYSKYEDFPESRTKRGMDFMMKLGAKLENGETMNRNWGGIMKDNIGEKQGICSRILNENGVHPNGDISACDCWDWNKELLIGNMNEQSLEEIYSNDSKYSKLLNNQFKNIYEGPCIKCDDFSPARYYHFQIPWTKIYKLFYK